MPRGTRALPRPGAGSQQPRLASDGSRRPRFSGAKGPREQSVQKKNRVAEPPSHSPDAKKSPYENRRAIVPPNLLSETCFLSCRDLKCLQTPAANSNRHHSRSLRAPLRPSMPGSRQSEICFRVAASRPRCLSLAAPASQYGGKIWSLCLDDAEVTRLCLRSRMSTPRQHVSRWVGRMSAGRRGRGHLLELRLAGMSLPSSALMAISTPQPSGFACSNKILPPVTGSNGSMEQNPSAPARRNNVGRSSSQLPEEVCSPTYLKNELPTRRPFRAWGGCRN